MALKVKVTRNVSNPFQAGGEKTVHAAPLFQVAGKAAQGAVGGDQILGQFPWATDITGLDSYP
jgi:hypothetical protein